jgi:hypothetical protein
MTTRAPETSHKRVHGEATFLTSLDGPSVG